MMRRQVQKSKSHKDEKKNNAHRKLAQMVEKFEISQNGFDVRCAAVFHYGDGHNLVEKKKEWQS